MEFSQFSILTFPFYLLEQSDNYWYQTRLH